MLTVSLMYFDEVYYQNNHEVLGEGEIWHTAHEKWMSVYKTLSEDWVVEKLPAKLYSRYHYRPYILVFAKNGSYGIYKELNYKWSKVYALSDEGVYNYTKIDDEFYVISVGKHKNLVAYNKRMFELK